MSYNYKSTMLIKPGNLPRINIVGCGAVGSKIADLLSRYGISAHLYDFDKVEEKNIGNQLFGINDVGMYKVDAVCRTVKETCDVNHIPHREKVTGKLDGITFLAVDTVRSGRKPIVKANRLNLNSKLVIDCRMGVFDIRVYAFDPKKSNQYKNYMSTIENIDEDKVDSEDLISVCGIRQDLASTSHVIAGLAVNKLVYWSLLHQKRETETMVNEVIVNFRNSLQVLETTWK